MFAARRCAARAARFGGLAAPPVCVDIVAPVLLAADRPLAEFAVAIFRRSDLAAFMLTIMTDQSVIIKIKLHMSGQSVVIATYLTELERKFLEIRCQWTR
jgi:hypothetical protein